MRLLLVWLGVGICAAAAAAVDEAGVKVFQLQYVDPELIRGLFAGQSSVLDANRDLKVLTAHGPAAFLKQVEDAVKKFDVAAPAPVNLQVTVYLLASTGTAALPKDLTGPDWSGLKLADSQVIRVRAGQGGDAASLSAAAPEATSLLRTHFDSAVVGTDPKTPLISLNGLHVWLSVPSAADAKQKTEPDIAATLDVAANQGVLVAKAGVDKPVAVVVRALVVK